MSGKRKASKDLGQVEKETETVVEEKTTKWDVLALEISERWTDCDRFEEFVPRVIKVLPEAVEFVNKKTGNKWTEEDVLNPSTIFSGSAVVTVNLGEGYHRAGCVTDPSASTLMVLAAANLLTRKHGEENCAPNVFSSVIHYPVWAARPVALDGSTDKDREETVQFFPTARGPIVTFFTDTVL